MKDKGLPEIPLGTPGFVQDLDIIPERPFMLPAGGSIELKLGRPGQPDEFLVYGCTGQLLDRVAVTVKHTDTGKA